MIDSFVTIYNKHPNWYAGVLALVMSCAIYIQSLNYEYVLDDKIVFTENKFVKNGFDGLIDILGNESFTGYFGKQQNLVEGSRYRPLSLLTFNLEYSFFGANKRISHLINLILYALCGFLIFVWITKLIPHQYNLAIGIIAMIVFIAHPIHVEAVANVKGRDEILSLGLSLLTFIFAIKYYDHPKFKHLIGTCVLLFISLLAKENALTFLAIIPLGLLLFRPPDKPKIITLCTALSITSLLYLLLRYQVIGYLIQDNTITDLLNNSFAEMNTNEKYATIGYTMLEYLRLNLIGYPLTHDYYPYHIPKVNFGNARVWLSILINSALIIWAILNLKNRSIPAFGILFYYLALSIVSNIIISIGTFMNERFAFSASLGICIVISYAIVTLSTKVNRLWLMGLLTLLVTIPYFVVSVNRVPAWQSELALNSAAIKVSKNSARANSFMATALFNQYNKTNDKNRKIALLTKAKPFADKAVKIHPEYYNGNKMKVGIAAELYQTTGDLNGLLHALQEAIWLRPDIPFITEYLDYLNGKEDKNKLAQFYIETCIEGLIDEQRKYDWAIHFLSRAYKAMPNYIELRRGIRKAYIGAGNMEAADNYK